ncbi:hypothetical protein RV12_GL002808 [Enterococcus quebecensis]|nr:hypothetical protein RV12_GL002808 [Enterococcus quebecensis]
MGNLLVLVWLIDNGIGSLDREKIGFFSLITLVSFFVLSKRRPCKLDQSAARRRKWLLKSI